MTPRKTGSPGRVGPDISGSYGGPSPSFQMIDGSGLALGGTFHPSRVQIFGPVKNSSLEDKKLSTQYIRCYYKEKLHIH